MLKAKLYAIFAGIVAFLLALVKILWGRAQKQKKRADRAEAQVEFKEAVEDSDSELSKDLSSRKAKISKEIEDEKSVTSLSNPNSNW